MPDDTAKSEPPLEHAELLAHVSHELATPLAVARGHAQMISDGSRVPEQAPEHAKVMMRHIDFALLLLDRYRAAGPLENTGLDLDLQWLDLVDLAATGLDDLKPIVLVHHPTRFEIEHATAPINVKADRLALLQVLFNLLTNATRHSPHGQTIVITVTATSRHAHLIVRDHGAGLPPGPVDRLFTAYTRGTNSGPGLGLGLYIARQIVRAHGGQLTGERAEHGGSRFTVSVPTTTQPPLAPRNRHT